MPVETYERVETAAAYRLSLTGADNVDLTDASIVALPEVLVAGAPTIELSARCDTAGATIVVHLIRYADDSNTIRSVTERTLTASSAGVTVDSISNNIPTIRPTYLDTGSARSVRVAVRAPSAGSWDLWVVPVGPRRS